MWLSPPWQLPSLVFPCLLAAVCSVLPYSIAGNKFSISCLWDSALCLSLCCLWWCLVHLPQWFAKIYCAGMENVACLPSLYCSLSLPAEAQAPSAAANGSEPVIRILKCFLDHMRRASCPEGKEAAWYKRAQKIVKETQEWVGNVCIFRFKVSSIVTHNNSSLYVSWVSFPKCLLHTGNYAHLINPRD